MHAKIMLLPGNDMGRALLAFAEQALCDIGAAFGHGFTFKEEKIGEDSLRAYATEMTEETVEACASVDAALAGDFALKGIAELTDGLDARLALRDMRVPAALCALSPLRAEEALCACVATALKQDGQSLRKTAREMMAFARACDMEFTHVPAQGRAQDDWRAAMLAVAGEDIGNVMRPLAAAQVLPRAIAAPSKTGMVVCQSAAGSIIRETALALCGAPALAYDAYLGGACGVFAPSPQEGAGAEELNPLGVYRTVAAMLRFSLNMEREAGCLDAAVSNVIEAGWRTRDIASPGQPRIGAAAMADLVTEQIMLAGQFLHR